MFDVHAMQKAASRGAADVPVPAAGIWDAEWMRTWKAHPENVWFDYEAGVYLDEIRRDGDGPVARLLKTDAFDEACGRRRLITDLGAGVTVVMDVSPQVARHAARVDADGLVACATDVRCLPFAPATFDFVLSTSTLDHFDDRGDIARSLAELRTILRPGGRLFVTFDNPANPILRLRQRLYRRTGSIGGVLPFRMGLTLSRGALVAAAERAGFEVRASGYLVHAPRVLALWVGEWAARRASPGAARRIGAVLRAIERLARRLPTRRWSSHFIFAECRASEPAVAGGTITGGAGGATTARAVRPYRLSPWVLRWKHAELRLRGVYLRRTPPALLARIDPPLRRAVALARRTVATPIYLRHPITRYTGRSDDATGRVDVWSPLGAPGGLLAQLLDGPTKAEPEQSGEPCHLGAIARYASDADVLIAHTTPLLAPYLRRAGFHIVPGMVRFGGAPAALLAQYPTPGLRGDAARLRRADYRTEHWPHTPARSRLFYDRYLLPHAHTRFQERAEVPGFEVIDRLFMAGALVAVRRPGVDDPDVLGLVVPRGEVLWCVLLGTRDADRAILRHGGMAALYRGQIQCAYDRGARLVDFGRCVPWASDGVVQYKLKWGLQPIPDGTQTLEYAVKVLRPASAIARRLVERGVMIRKGQSYRPFAPADLSAR